jgi:hypothetical protein
MADVPYQNASQVEQALAERENAVAYGQETLVEAADKVLARFGITSKSDRTAASKNRKAAADEPTPAPDEKPAAKKAPQGRTSTPPAQQDAKRP